MRIASITSGAAGMFCGSCLHDNALVTALRGLGHDALLIPTYTPIRTDEPNVSQRRIFLGGLNVYFNYKSALFRRLPRFVHRWLDRPSLLNALSRFTATPDYAALGEITLSMLRGEDGRQREEVDRLADWLSADIKPDVVTLSNVLLSGIAPALKRRLNVPIVAYLQGDDIFLEALPPEHRTQAIELIRANAAHIDGFVATCAYYSDHMAGYLGLPRSAIEVILPGINLAGNGGPREQRTEPPYAVGYFARIAPEKGLHLLADAYIRMRRMPNAPPCRLRASGWLGAQHRPYLDSVRQTLAAAGLADEFEYVDSPDHIAKVRFLESLDVLSVPTTYREPKGLYVLEALANGVPVVQPNHGSFPELIAATGGGLRVAPNDPADLARGLHQLLTNSAQRLELGRMGKKAVHEHFSSAGEARRTAELLGRHVH
jgi:glycosyltransferase involved in cell wall biosynthesis